MIGKRVGVLDKGYVELLDMMPHPATGVSGDLAIVNAARTSYLGESKGEEADKKLLFYLMRHHHDSPFEQAEMKFRIKAPLVTFWQLVRHRTAHINMQSGRYTEFEEDEFYVPKYDEWRLQSEANKQGSDGFLDIEHGTDLMLQLEHLMEQSMFLYQTALGYGVAKEQARLFLPGFAAYYTAVWKIDVRNLMHFLQLRMHPHAQYEIRVYAKAMYEQFFKPTFPWTAEAFEQYVLEGSG